MRSMLWRHSPQIVFNLATMTKVQKSRWWYSVPSCVCFLSLTHISSNWQVTSLHILNIPVRQDRCYSRILTCSHTYCTRWHTQTHSLPKTTSHVKGKPRQISSSPDISATLLTIVPVWEKVGLWVENILWCHLLKRDFMWVLMYKDVASQVFRRYFPHHRWRLSCNICLLRSLLIAGQTLVKIKLLRCSRMPYNFERALAIGIFLLLWSTARGAQ